MAEYIEREKLIESIKNDCCELVYYSKKDAIDGINAEPAADIAPVVHGRWIRGGYVFGETEWKCSNCGETEWRTSCSRMKYCMFCGAKMDEGEKANE